MPFFCRPALCHSRRTQLLSRARRRRSHRAATVLGMTILLGAIGADRARTSSAGTPERLGYPMSGSYANSINMQFVRIEPGTFTMGVGATPLPTELLEGKAELANGDFDEQPNHLVTITRPFYIGIHEVTNAEYEQFDPAHHALRGKLGFSVQDNEAVVFVSWNEARAFCDWLSAREGLPYRLPTEAEWEYACRAGTATHYHTGDSLPAAYRKNQIESWYPDPDRVTTFPDDYAPQLVPLTVGQTPPNPWGLYDMHGNVEEWCYDWYGPYQAGTQLDPVGRVDGDFRVTRGGSHGTIVYYLRSANRLGALPEDKSWLIGFRVVLGALPTTSALPVPPPQPYQQNVSQVVPPDIADGPDPTVPYFRGPRKYVKIGSGLYGPLFSNHNHDPAIVDCPNGDLLAIWYTTVSEAGRYMALAASRLRYANRYATDPWESASAFWDAPDRNDHAPAMWHDGHGTIHHFNGLSAAATWGNLALIQRTSTDNGVTWSKARLIAPEHGIRHQCAESVFRTSGGTIIVAADASSRGNGGTALHLSNDNGLTWFDPGGKTAGIHAGVVELLDGWLMALGRGDTIGDMMPKSLSSDLGGSWTCSASVFRPIGSGQRLVLIRLMEGPLFMASFADYMEIVDRTGRYVVYGLFGALSFNEGVTWPVRRLISDESGRMVETTDGATFAMTRTNAEPKGYLSVTQTPDRVIQLISSRQHYAFNLAWLMERACLSMKGDFDCDGDVDLADFSRFHACFNGPNRPPTGTTCTDPDFDVDSDVDLADFGRFQACFNGANRPPACR
jgi:sulfatase modifying factor 1